MTEAELMSAATQATQLGYAAGQWWITMTTALLVGLYFAGKHIPRWLFVVILVLYGLNVFSVVVEAVGYADLSQDYGASLEAMRLARHVTPSIAGTDNPVVAFLANAAIYLIYIIGSLSAVAYSATLWRKARAEAGK